MKRKSPARHKVTRNGKTFYRGKGSEMNRKNIDARYTVDSVRGQAPYIMMMKSDKGFDLQIMDAEGDLKKSCKASKLSEVNKLAKKYNVKKEHIINLD